MLVQTQGRKRREELLPTDRRSSAAGRRGLPEGQVRFPSRLRLIQLSLSETSSQILPHRTQPFIQPHLGLIAGDKSDINMPNRSLP